MHFEFLPVVVNELWLSYDHFLFLLEQQGTTYVLPVNDTK